MWNGTAYVPLSSGGGGGIGGSGALPQLTYWVGPTTVAGDISLTFLPSLGLNVSPTANPATSSAAFALQQTTHSTSQRQFLTVLGLTSNAGTNDNVGLYVGVDALFGTPDVWAMNPVLTQEASSGSYNAQGIEVDLNNLNADRGNADAGSGLSAPVSYGLSVTGASTHRKTAGIAVYENAQMLNRGIVFGLDSIEHTNGSTFQDLNQAHKSIDIRGAATYGVYQSNPVTGSPHETNNWLNGGVILGPITAANLPTAHQRGRIIWVTDDDTLRGDNGTTWVTIGPGGGGGSGITQLNGLSAVHQTLVPSNVDANLSLTINSVTATHTFIASWVGTLAPARGGTGQDTSAWSALPLVTGGVWSQYAGTGACPGGQFISQVSASGVATCGAPAGSGTVTHTAGALTLHAPIVGNGAADIKALAVMTNGQLLIGSTGNDPVLGSIGSNTLVVTGGAGTLTIDTPPITNHAVVVGRGATVALAGVGPLTNGQLLIGSTGNDPVPATLTCTGIINCTTGAGSITVTASGTPTVSGTTPQVAYFTTSTNLGGDAGFWWDNTRKQLSAPLFGVRSEPITISSITRSGSSAQVTTTGAHGFYTGEIITVSGANISNYNGDFPITWTGSTTFTYTIAGTPANPTCPCLAQIFSVSDGPAGYTLFGNTQFNASSTAPLIVSTLTHATTTATATTQAPHGLTTGTYVLITGASPILYNGMFQITSTGASTFTYVMASAPASNATGTILAALPSINDLQGDRLAATGFSTSTIPGSRWELIQGSASVPTSSGPSFKISRTESLRADTSQCNNSVDDSCHAGLTVISKGLSTTRMQTVGIYSQATGSGVLGGAGTLSDTVDVVGLTAFGSHTGDGTAAGAFITGHYGGTGTGNSIGIEVHAENFSSGKSCSYNAGGVSNCVGVMAVANTNGGQTNGPGYIVTGGGGLGWNVGFACTSGSTTDTCFRDDSSSANFLYGTGAKTTGINFVDLTASNAGIFLPNAGGATQIKWANGAVVTMGGFTLATLVSSPPGNGSQIYCTDCKNATDGGFVAGVCVSGGTGNHARRLNAQYLCS